MSVGMNTMQDEIRELNLAYLILAQQMLRVDRAAAIYRLKILILQFGFFNIIFKMIFSWILDGTTVQ